MATVHFPTIVEHRDTILGKHQTLTPVGGSNTRFESSTMLGAVCGALIGVGFSQAVPVDPTILGTVGTMMGAMLAAIVMGYLAPTSRE
jgi:uncharacterized membrane protein